MIPRLTLLLAMFAAPAAAQTADNVLLVINEASPASVEVGEYYALKRAVADDHIVRISPPAGESLDVRQYRETIETPVAEWLSGHDLLDRVLYIVLTKDVPIRILGTGGRNGTVASVDSELTLLYRRLVGTSTTMVGRTPNPYFLGDRSPAEARPFRRQDHDIYLVTRLDGYTVEDAKALVDRGLAPSRVGRIVLDQRGRLLDSGGDRWLQRAADNLEVAGAGSRLVLESTSELATTTGPVLGYYSWGSNDGANRLRDPGLDFAPGALAGQFVSTDGRTFREPPPDWLPGPSNRPPSMFGSGSQSMAADLIRAGATGVSAHVDEPYLDGTARPQVLFPTYLAGMNLAEAYYQAIPFLSWQTMVLGDPLCAPFRVEILADEDLHDGMDPETELPALFASRRVEVLAARGYDEVALRKLLRAGVHAERDDTAGAIPYLVEAVALEPRLTTARLQLAGYYEADEDFDDAIAQYRAVVAKEPRNSIALNNLAYALAVRKDELDEALPLAKMAFSLSPGPAVADTLGWIHHLLGDDAEAVRFMDQAVTVGSAETRLHAAIVFAGVGRLSDAREALAAAEQLDPTFAERDDFKTLRQRLGGS